MNKPVYAEVNKSTQQIGGSRPEGWISMTEQRPSPDHIAQGDGTWLYPEEEVTRREFKRARQEAVDAITVTTSAGNTFDGDETSQNRMARALIGMQDDDTIKWVLADNSEVMVGKTEFAEALYLAGQEQSRLWTQGE